MHQIQGKVNGMSQGNAQKLFSNKNTQFYLLLFDIPMLIHLFSNDLKSASLFSKSLEKRCMYIPMIM